jgi:hypothetical protein
MVVVPVRDQNPIDCAVERGGRSGAAQVDDPLAEERVGEHVHAVELEEHRRVPQPANLHRR